MECPICKGNDFTDFLDVKDWSISQENFQLVTCNNCQMTITTHIPDQSVIGRYYASDVYISHSDTRSTFMDHLYHWVRSTMLKRKSKIVQDASGKAVGKLLDIGSGTGYFPGYMKEIDWSVTGVEIDKDTREKSIERFNFEVNSVDQFYSLQDKQFDAVTMWHVLEHVKDLDGYLSRIYQLISDGGSLVIAVPNMNSKDAKIYGAKWAAYDVPRHLWHFKHENMKTLVESYDFSLVKMLGMPMDAYYVSMLSEKYRKSRFPMLLGLFNGLMSNLNAWGKPEKSSSVIYIFKK